MSQHEKKLLLKQSLNFDESELVLDLIKAFQNGDDPILKYSGFFLNSDQHKAVFLPFHLSLEDSLTEKDFDALYNQFSKFINSTESSFVKPINGIKMGFYKSAVFPDLSFFIAAPAELNRYTVVKIVFGIILVVSLIAISIFVIYAIIIKKMTTSIDILRSVSKKVAKGDFNQHIFISSKDEIGELSTAFNSMVSQLKESTATIIEQKEQSDAIISCIPDGIIVTTFKNELILANPKAEFIFEFKTDDHRGESIESFIKYKLFEEHAKQLKKKSMFTSEFVYRKPNNEQVFLMSSTIVKNEHKKPIGIVYVFRDVTREKQIEELREGFLRTVSHELRTPLTSVIGFIELVTHDTRNPLDEHQVTYLNTALKEASSLKTLIDDLLDFSHIQAGKTKLNVQHVNIHELVSSVALSLSPLVKAKSLQFKNLIEDKAIAIRADETKLRRILVNLITNAIKFTEEGEISIECNAHESYVEFKVRDTGIGLKKQEQEIIFEKFLQIDHSSTREYEGIGLGLSIVKELVELHNGRIYVESEFGFGSTFVFTLEKKESKKRRLTAA